MSHPTKVFSSFMGTIQNSKPLLKIFTLHHNSQRGIGIFILYLSKGKIKAFYSCNHVFIHYRFNRCYKFKRRAKDCFRSNYFGKIV